MTSAAPAIHRYVRKVRFEEVDAAGIVFFAHLVRYAHEAMESFFDGVDGGYVALITQRKIGFPAVRLESDFVAPVRYGESLIIETSLARLGNKSATFRYRMLRQADGSLRAHMRHTVVITDLTAMKSCPMPADVRAWLQRHLLADAADDSGQAPSRRGLT